MKKLGYVMLLAMMIASLVSWGVLAGELPESVQKQSRKDAKEAEEWTQHDSSGLVKFLQVQSTAAASPADSASKLDGSVGERRIEVKVDASIQADVIAWSLENKGPGAVWVIASSDDGIAEAIEIQAEATVELEVKLMDGYCYLVVDSDGKNETTVSIKAAVGEDAAKTVRGKDMVVVWF
jgi:hypothetical protein